MRPKIICVCMWINDRGLFSCCLVFGLTYPEITWRPISMQIWLTRISCYPVKLSFLLQNCSLFIFFSSKNSETLAAISFSTTKTYICMWNFWWRCPLWILCITFRSLTIHSILENIFHEKEVGLSYCFSRVFHSYTKLAMLALMPTLYSHMFAVFFFICTNWY